MLFTSKIFQPVVLCMLNVSVTEILRVLSRGIYIMTNGLAIFGLFEKRKNTKLSEAPSNLNLHPCDLEIAYLFLI